MARCENSSSEKLFEIKVYQEPIISLNQQPWLPPDDVQVGSTRRQSSARQRFSSVPKAPDQELISQALLSFKRYSSGLYRTLEKRKGKEEEILRIRVFVNSPACRGVVETTDLRTPDGIVVISV